MFEKLDVELGYFDGLSKDTGNMTKRDSTFFLYNNHFCLIRKSGGINFNNAIKELKAIFKMIDEYITPENMITHFKNKYKPKK